MSLKLVIRVVASVAVLAVAGVAVAAGSGVVGTDDSPSYELAPPKITPSGPIVNFENLEMGETRNADFSLQNVNKARADVLLSGKVAGVDTDLFDVLTAKLTNDDSGKVLWDGGLRQMLAGAALGEMRGVSSTDYRIAVGVPSWAGDAFGAKRATFDLDFVFSSSKKDFDHLAPLTSINLRRSMTRRKFVKVMRRGKRSSRRARFAFYGTAKDRDNSVARVEISLIRRYTVVRRGKRVKLCNSFVPLRKRFVRTSRKKCKPFWITANGADKWSYRFPALKLGKGAYEVKVRASDPYGNQETKFRRIGDKVNFIRYRVR